jgi:hypothetical protein
LKVGRVVALRVRKGNNEVQEEEPRKGDAELHVCGVDLNSRSTRAI